jgi:hypothetical protein
MRQSWLGRNSSNAIVRWADALGVIAESFLKPGIESFRDSVATRLCRA